MAVEGLIYKSRFDPRTDDICCFCSGAILVDALCLASLSEGQGVVKRRGGGNRGKDGDVGCGGWCGEGGGGGQRAPLCVLIPFIVGALVSEDLISRQICQ